MNRTYLSSPFHKGQTVEAIIKSCRRVHKPGTILDADARMYFVGEDVVFVAKNQPLTALIAELYGLPKAARLEQPTGISLSQPLREAG